MVQNVQGTKRENAVLPVSCYTVINYSKRVDGAAEQTINEGDQMDIYNRESPTDEARGRKRKHRHSIDSLQIIQQFLDAMNAEVFHLRCPKLKSVLTDLDTEIELEKARHEIKMEECREIILMQGVQLEQALNQVVGAK